MTTMIAYDDAIYYTSTSLYDMSMMPLDDLRKIGNF
jgi:hypothetical protein